MKRALIKMQQAQELLRDANGLTSDYKKKSCVNSSLSFLNLSVGQLTLHLKSEGVE